MTSIRAADANECQHCRVAERCTTRNLPMVFSDSASSIAKFLSYQIEESKVNFKKALRDTLKEIDKKSNIRGIRINCSGRLGKNPMAKTEWFKYGQVPLNQINILFLKHFYFLENLKAPMLSVNIACLEMRFK